jgi:5'-nucleotidase
MTRPYVLLANDDGYLAPGIRALREALLPIADVVVCAPATEQSATSHSITLNRPLRLWEAEPGIFSVDGTPADSVYVALHSAQRVIKRRPDLVVSGMNHGLNLGNDVFYSGTVAAAREGALRGYSAMAFSAHLSADLAAACSVASRLVQRVIAQASEETVLYNVNFPPGNQWQVTASSLGQRAYDDGVEFRADPRGGEYLWIGGRTVTHLGGADTDTGAFDRGLVGVTPLSLKLWADRHQRQVEQLVTAYRETEPKRG